MGKTAILQPKCSTVIIFMPTNSGYLSQGCFISLAVHLLSAFDRSVVLVHCLNFENGAVCWACSIMPKICLALESKHIWK